MRPKRFPDTITRRRESPGMRNNFGEWIPGSTTDEEFSASVQPVSLEDENLLEGARSIERIKVLIPEPDVLRAAFDDAAADVVVFESREFTTEKTMAWPKHTAAIASRTT